LVRSKYPFRVHRVSTFTYREDNGVLSIKRGQYSTIKISLADVIFLSRLGIKAMEKLIEARELPRCHRNTIVDFVIAVKQGRADLHKDLGITVKH
jgi:hypothetical protein